LYFVTNNSTNTDCNLQYSKCKFALKAPQLENDSKNWFLLGNAALNEKLLGTQNITELANNTISFLCTYLKANIGALYLLDETEKTLVLGKFCFYLKNTKNILN
jgi:hypothetical protein